MSTLWTQVLTVFQNCDYTTSHYVNWPTVHIDKENTQKQKYFIDYQLPSPCNLLSTYANLVERH